MKAPMSYSPAQLSVVIPTINEEERLALCLEALAPAAIDGFIKEVIIVDGGSSDETLKIADAFGARIFETKPGRGGQLKIGADNARGEWLLFLHGDTLLKDDWINEARDFVESSSAGAAVFSLRFDKQGFFPKLVAAGAMLRTKLASSPYGDQGLLISKSTYEKIGGFNDIPLFEDVDFVRRLVKKQGGKALTVFQSQAVTAATRYERDGYLMRVFKNAILLLRYHMGASPEKLSKSYR